MNKYVVFLVAGLIFVSCKTDSKTTDQPTTDQPAPAAGQPGQTDVTQPGTVDIPAGADGIVHHYICEAKCKGDILKQPETARYVAKLWPIIRHGIISPKIKLHNNLHNYLLQDRECRPYRDNLQVRLHHKLHLKRSTFRQERMVSYIIIFVRPDARAVTLTMQGIVQNAINLWHIIKLFTINKV